MAENLSGQLWQVPPEDLDLLWLQVEPLLDAATAVSRGRENTTDIRKLLADRVAQLFIWWENERIELLAVVQVIEHSRKTVGRVKACAGRPHVVSAATMRHCMLEIEKWARVHGATAMVFEARQGWEAMLAPLGYRRTMALLEKEMSDG